MADDEYNPWEQYEPEPPRCTAILVDGTNFDDLEKYLSLGWRHHIKSVTKHTDLYSGDRSLTISFLLTDDQTYEVTVKPYEVLYQSPDTDGRYAVMNYQEFRRLWRKRVSQ